MARPLGGGGARRRRADPGRLGAQAELAPQLVGPPPRPARAADARRGAPGAAAGAAAAAGGPPPFEDWRVVAAAAATLGLTGLLRRRGRPISALREGVAQALGAVPALVALMDRDLPPTNGVEHKAIAAYEQGIDDVASVPKEHDRCGST